MTDISVRATKSQEKPKYKRTAAELLSRCREFYEDPENEKAFQEWKAAKEGSEKRAV